ncbi:hypothetical protein B0H34DRAFT_802072 [Crassisporium funariophilum]|nr:hypothetical protein B0H34DRAFT_802072 [Crassisporium funariophilum]
MTSITRLTVNAATLTKFLVTCATEANTPYVLCGANALIARGVISRSTNDVDFHIAPYTSRVFQGVVVPKLNNALQEGLRVDGKTQELKDNQTKFRIFKAFSEGNNMKADVSESDCIYLPSASSEVGGIKVASVALMVVFKTCATARKNRDQGKMLSDLGDLDDALRHLVERKEIVADELQVLFNREIPSFTWKAFWESVDDMEFYNPAALEDMFHKVNIKKTRD